MSLIDKALNIIGVTDAGSKTTINNLKRELGPGIGLRKNKYRLELPWSGGDSKALNILCQKVSLPEYRLNTVDVWHKGRRYTMKGETDFVGDFEISILDDSKMTIRRMFDDWFKRIDNTHPDKNSSMLGASFEAFAPGLLGNINSAVNVASSIKGAFANPKQLLNFGAGLLDLNKELPIPDYQIDINIWQLDGNENGVYGYKIQNAFPKAIGSVQMGDSDENTLTEFTVTFGFSEFLPLKGAKEDFFGGIFGDANVDTFNNAKKLLK